MYCKIPDLKQNLKFTDISLKDIESFDQQINQLIENFDNIL